ncbi:hypothetical protein AX14_001535 [Amanita brunnescens Koide BX004]|nr:hypothetical protein AX14_001535 [Amanita brunnescens Koide BX004]
MYRIAIARLARPAARPHIQTTVVAHRPFIRFKSDKSEIEKEKKARLERFDDLQRDWDARILTYEELKQKTQHPTPNTYLIDVREPDEVVQGMIPSAINIPLSVLGASLHLGRDDFKDKHGFDKPRRNQEVIFYCRSGVRSSTASDVAKRNGYKKILNYKGSWLDIASARHFLSQQCTRVAMMARIAPLLGHTPRHLRAFSTPPPQNNERFGRGRLHSLRHDDDRHWR